MKNKILLEIKAAEGGDDAKLLVDEHLYAYEKLGRRNCL
jgi:protein subunit release factor A